MVLALDPRIPHVWRTPDCVQFGVDEPVLVLDGLTAPEEHVLAGLDAGLTPAGLAMVAERVGADDRTVSALLERLAPVLVRRVRMPPPPPRLIAIDGSGRTAATLERLLTGSGVDVRLGAPIAEEDGQVDAAVIVAAYAVEPLRHARWLRRDIPHLPIVFGDRGVTVGPLIRPGRGPCLRCIDLHRTEEDPAWPAMATQLHTRRPPGETPVAAAAAAARAATLLLRVPPEGSNDDRAGELRPVPGTRRPTPIEHRPATAASARLPTDGTDWVSRTWAPHPDCGCLGLPP